MRPIREGLLSLKIIEIYGHESDKGERVQGADDVIAFIKSKQEWSQMKGFIQKIKPSDEEVNFQLFSPEVEGVPRFNLHIVDAISNKNEMAFFIVSGGREFDWLYSTKDWISFISVTVDNMNQTVYHVVMVTAKIITCQ